jgi:predicted ATPase/class 3 adenylate cyclase
MTEPDRTRGGTVTLLFTDIEGSTRLELAIGTSRYAALRERHRELLRAAIARYRGEEKSTAGDSFFVVFPTARDGVLAAVEAQRALAAEAWPDDAPVRVRMGLHTGEVECAGGDLVGYTINRAARIAAVAHGGQIILSEATLSLVVDGLPDDVSLRDLGEHRLKDLRAPERLTQICGTGLQADFPALRSLDVHPNNLPTQLTSFVGREHELAAALDLLSGTRLLTLTGPGGIGKTRLSVQLAAAAADDFPDGVWFVPLEPVRERDFVAPTIARTMGIAERPDRTAVDAIADEIAGGRVLFVLDNFEQVLAAAPVVTDLLGRCPGLSIVVSSRSPLHVSGEQEYSVPGLPTPPDPSEAPGVERFNVRVDPGSLTADRLEGYEAVRLFVARARSVRSSFVLDDRNAWTIARICARLHGMPLAIELAAARMKVLSPDQILARLEDRLALLTAGSRDLPARQQTLRGAIAWSYELLGSGSRRLLDRLSVFVGGCDFETMETVCGPARELDSDPLDAITVLVDQSLVRADESTEGIRYAMLDSIRAYAAEMLSASGEEETIRDRHARAFLLLAEEAAPHLSGADQRSWLDRLERDHDNLRAALAGVIERRDVDVAVRFAFALWRFWQQRGYLNEAKTRLRDLEEADWELTTHQRARLAEACGGIAYWRADHESAKRWYDVALASWRELGDEREIANALYNRAYADVIVLLGGEASGEQAETTRAMLVEALGIYERLGDASGEGNILWALGSLEIFSRNGSAAVEWYRRSLERHRTAGHRTMEAWSLHMLAMSLLITRDADEARTSAADALRHFRDAGDVAGVTLVLDDLASVAVLDGDASRAGVLWGGARQLEERTGTGLARFNEVGAEAMGMPTVRAFVAPDDLRRYAAIGAAMSLDEIVAFALESPDRSPDPAGHEAGRRP